MRIKEYGTDRNDTILLLHGGGLSWWNYQSLHIKTDLFEDYYRDTCRIKKSDMIAFLKANTAYILKDSLKESSAMIHVYFGEKENREIICSAEAICRKIPSCYIHRMKGLRHGELSINHADQYADAIRQIVRG